MRFPLRLESDSVGNDSLDSCRGPISAKQVLPQATFFQCDDVSVAEVCFEANANGRDCTWLYQTGDSDPVQFAAEALACGASSIITDQLLPCPLPQAIVSDVEEAASLLIEKLNDEPNKRLLTIGVVGNAGKTTTSLMIASVLRSMGLRTAYETDLGYCDGVLQSVEPESNAKGARLVQRLADACDAECSAIVIECTQDAAAVHCGVRWDLLVVTGSSRMSDHELEDHHFGPDAIEAALENMASDGVVLVPSDEPKLLRRIDDSGCKRLTYGVRRPADISAKVIDNQMGEMTLMVSCAHESVAMTTKHCGEAMALNQLAAISVAMLLESTLVQAVQWVSSTPNIPGRMQYISRWDSAPLVIDAAGDHQRLASTLRSLRQQRLPGGKLWCILTLDQTASPMSEMELMHCGRVMERLADHIVLTSGATSKPSFLTSAHNVIDGFKRVAAARLVSNQSQAVRWALAHAKPHDVILVAGGLSGSSARDRRMAIQQLQNVIEQSRSSVEAPVDDPKILPLPWVNS